MNMLFFDWFDITDRRHLLALSLFEHDKKWPQHFLPADVTLTDTCVKKIKDKIVMAWINSHPETRD